VANVKVAILCSDFLSGKGGMETVITTVISELQNQGDTVKLFLRGGYESKEWIAAYENVEVLGSDRNALTLTGKMKFIIGVLLKVRKYKPDVILATNPTAVFIAKVCSALSKRPMLVGSWNHFPLSVLGSRKLLKYADFHLAINSGISNDIRQQIYRASKENVYTVFNPTKLTKENIPRAKALPEFIYIGRLMSGGPKRVSDFLRSLAGIKGHWKATILGDGQDAGSLVELAEELGINENIHWNIGWKEDPWSEIKTASVLVLTSEYEGFPMVLVEAMARGIPCIGSNCSAGISDIIAHGHNGWLYPMKDNFSLTQLMQNIVDVPNVLPDPDTVKRSAQRFSNEKVVGDIRKAIAREHNKVSYKGSQASP
jgi:UDP-D-galactose:(glucosyl)LPS alpha-1,6-D-galactosyltransferase